MKTRTSGIIGALLALGVAAAVFPAHAVSRPASPSGRHKNLPAFVPVPRDSLWRALESGRLSGAEYALTRAQSLFEPAAVARRFGAVEPVDPHSASLVLRDLFVRRHLLSGEDARLAEEILARPTDGASDPLGFGYSAPSVNLCSVNFCVHWVESTGDAPDLTDADLTGLPDYPETVLVVLEEVWATEVGLMNFKSPKSDLTSPNNGGDGRLDVYLANLGSAGYYGYCTSDDPNRPGPSYPFYDVSAYCVLDDDYAESIFSVNSQLANVQVTAAHEFFHAVQFAYDAYEDSWLMEGTASWMEDEVYDDVDDNRQYLHDSALKRPEVPVDFGAQGFQYGAWLFWRFLSEYVGDPAIVKEVWERADGSATAAFGDEHSTKAAEGALATRGTNWRGAFADFGAANLTPELFYEEGASYLTSVGGVPLTKRFRLTGSKLATGPQSLRLDHLTNRYVKIKRAEGIGSGAKLRVELDLPEVARGSEATLLSFNTDGSVDEVDAQLSSAGDQILKVPFGKNAVRYVVIVLTNSSIRYNCWTGSDYACLGDPRDDNLSFAYKAKVIR